MTRCELYQSQLLDYLYDLLEVSEEAALTDHLAVCERCRARLAESEREQQLLAAAAKLSFPEVQFEAPPAVPLSRPVTVSAAQKRFRVFSRRHAAAAVLLLGAILSVGALGVHRYQRGETAMAEALQSAQARRLAAQAAAQPVLQPIHEKLADARRVEEERRNLVEQSKALRRNLEGALAEKYSYLQVRGPDVLQAGAPSVYTIEARNLQEQEISANLVCRLVDATVREQQRAQARKRDLRSQKGIGNEAGLIPPALPPAANVTAPRPTPTPAEETTDAHNKQVFGLVRELPVKKLSPGKFQVVIPGDLELKPTSDVRLEITAQTEDRQPSRLTRELHLVPPVYVTHVTTDKPLYRPGDVVGIRSLTLDRFTQRPAEEPMVLIYRITDERGETFYETSGSALLVDPRQGGAHRGEAFYRGPDGTPVRGVGAAQVLLPSTLRPGEYTLTVSEANNRFAPETRRFTVASTVKDRLKKELEFDRRGYAPGEEVVAVVRLAHTERGKPLAEQPLLAGVVIDGKEYDQHGVLAAGSIAARTDTHGVAIIRFRLPEVIERGQGSLTVWFEEAGQLESFSRPLPILLRKVKVEFFPEGGDLVAGVPNRVYFAARSPQGRPVDISARLIGEDGSSISLETLRDPARPGANQGVGSFWLPHPQVGQKWVLVLEQPAGLEAEYSFPQVKPFGVVMNVPDPVLGELRPIRVNLTSVGKDRKLLVGAVCRGRLVAHTSVTALDGKDVSVELEPEGPAGGVYRITVFEEIDDGQRSGRQLLPVAERLVFRKPHHRLRLDFDMPRPFALPGEKMALGIRATDEKGQAAPSILYLAVVDRAVLDHANDRTARSMPTHFYLMTEVRDAEDLEDADFLLSEDPLAPVALDLLLGTQGWRRFAEQEPAAFRARYGQAAERLLVGLGNVPTQADNRHVVRQAYERELADQLALLEPAFQGRMNELLRRHEQREAALVAAVSPRDLEKRLGELQAELADADRDVFIASTRLADYRASWRGIGLGMVVLALVVVGAAAVLRAAYGDSRAHRRGLALAAAALLACAAPLYLLATGIAVPKPASVSGDLARLADSPRPLNARRAPQTSPQPQDDSRALQGNRLGELYADLLARTEQAAPSEADTRLLEEMFELAQARKVLGDDGYRDLARARRDAQRAAESAPRWQEKQNASVSPSQQGIAEARQSAETATGLVRQGHTAAPSTPPAPPISLPMQAVASKPTASAAPRVPAAINQRSTPPPPTRGGLQSSMEPRWLSASPLQDGQGTQSPTNRADLVMKDAVARLNYGNQKHRENDKKAEAPTMEGGYLGEFIRRRLGFESSNKEKADLDRVLQKAETFHVSSPDQQSSRQKGAAAFDPKQQNLLEREPVWQAAPFVVREYAHLRAPVQNEGRHDLTETVFWHPVLVLPHGVAHVSFDLHDVPTTYQVQAIGHTLEGRLGAATFHFEARPPLAVEMRLPAQISAGDRIDLPVQLANNSDGWRAVLLRVAAQGLELAASERKDQSGRLTLDPQSQGRTHVALRPTLAQGQASVCVEASSATQRHGAEGVVEVLADGFPVSHSKLVVFQRTHREEIHLPEEMRRASLQFQVQVYPTPMAHFLSTLKSAALMEDCDKVDAETAEAFTRKLVSGEAAFHPPPTPAQVAQARELAELLRRKQLASPNNTPRNFRPLDETGTLAAVGLATAGLQEAGELSLWVNGVLAARLPYPASPADVLTLRLPQAGAFFRAGKNDVRLEISSPMTLPARIGWTYVSERDPSDPAAAMTLHTALDKAVLQEGDTVCLQVEITNRRGKAKEDGVAVIGLPAGLALAENGKARLEALLRRDSGKHEGASLSSWELRGRELVLIVAGLAPDEKFSVAVELRGEIPGEYRGPASHVRAAGASSSRSYAAPLAVRIQSR